MTILVITRYENIPENEVKQWADKVFGMTWAPGRLSEEQLDEMKNDFLLGEEVGASSKDPADTGMQVTTKWKLDR